MNLLESAGFSRSNPYYIVKQGKVSLYSVKLSDVPVMKGPKWYSLKDLRLFITGTSKCIKGSRISGND